MASGPHPVLAESVDIVIPAFNAAATIEASIKSLLAQTYSPRHVIVVDDGSSDATGRLAAALDPRVTVVHQPNGGQGSARNRGFALSDAPLTLFLDADDELKAHALATLTDALRSRPDCSVAYCRAELFGEADLSHPLTGGLASNLDDAEEDVWFRLLQRNFIRTPGCVLMRRSVLIEAGGWEDCRESQGCEDWDLWLRLAERSRFVRVTEQLLRYRVHAASFSSRKDAFDRSIVWVLRKHLARQQSAALAAIRTGGWRSAAVASAGILSIWPRSAAWPLRPFINKVRSRWAK